MKVQRTIPYGLRIADMDLALFSWAIPSAISEFSAELPWSAPQPPGSWPRVRVPVSAGSVDIHTQRPFLLCTAPVVSWCCSLLVYSISQNQTTKWNADRVQQLWQQVTHRTKLFQFFEDSVGWQAFYLAGNQIISNYDVYSLITFKILTWPCSRESDYPQDVLVVVNVSVTKNSWCYEYLEIYWLSDKLVLLKLTSLKTVTVSLSEVGNERSLIWGHGPFIWH